MGLIFSMGIIMFSSSIIAKLMNKYGWLVYIGAGILGWTAGDMITSDHWLLKVYTPATALSLLFKVALTGAVLGIGFLLNRRQTARATTGA
jgi:predicted tellurium resistance membrane protein TerC